MLLSSRGEMEDTTWQSDWWDETFSKSGNDVWEHFATLFLLQNLAVEWSCSAKLLRLVSDNCCTCWQTAGGFCLQHYYDFISLVFVCLFKWTFDHKVFEKIRRCHHNPEVHRHCCHKGDFNCFMFSSYLKIGWRVLCFYVFITLFFI